MEEAARLGQKNESSVVAAVIWDGHPRADMDVTNEFRRDAQARGWRIIEILTL